MKEEYILYLDESEFTRSKTFSIGGIALKKKDIDPFSEDVLEIKKVLWSDKDIKLFNPVLHCTELETVYRNRKKGDNLAESEKRKLSSVYKKLITTLNDEEMEKKYGQVYGRLSKLVKKYKLTVFCCVIRLAKLKELYFIDQNHNGVNLIDDRFNIALQRIIENYTHYLTVVDGYGDVLYEARNSDGENSPKSPDIRLINNFHQIHANNRGIRYTSNKVVQERNRTIQVSGKNSDEAGLQVADFISYNCNKFVNNNVDGQITDFMKVIHRFSYNGGHTVEERDQRDFWGICQMPAYNYIQGLWATNKKLKNAYRNLKKEKNKLLQSSEELQNENALLKNEISNLTKKLVKDK